MQRAHACAWGIFDLEVYRRAQAAGITYLINGSDSKLLLRAIEDAIREHSALGLAMRTMISGLTAVWNLSPSQECFLESELWSLERCTLVNGKQLTEETCKSYRKKILAKARPHVASTLDNWDDLRRVLQRSVMRSPAPRSLNQS